MASAFALTATVGCADIALDPLQSATLETFQRHNRSELDAVQGRLHEHDPGQFAGVFLKVAFPVDSRGVRDEWMWVQVFLWQDDVIEGVLMNEPRRRADLHAGDYVTFAPARVADYLERDRNGREHGNALEQLLERGFSLYPTAVDGNMRAPR